MKSAKNSKELTSYERNWISNFKCPYLTGIFKGGKYKAFTLIGRSSLLPVGETCDDESVDSLGVGTELSGKFEVVVSLREKVD